MLEACSAYRKSSKGSTAIMANCSYGHSNHCTTGKQFSDDGPSAIVKCHDTNISQRPKPELLKLFVAYIYMTSGMFFTSLMIVFSEQRVPDKKQYPPLPDIVLENLPYISHGFTMSEVIAILLVIILIVLIILHKHRFIIVRRFFAICGTAFVLRGSAMILTTLSVPDIRTACSPKIPDLTARSVMEKAFTLFAGLGMSLSGIETCSDLIFSGHTTFVTMVAFFITEYSPRNLRILRVSCWMLACFAMFLILGQRSHYSIDVFIAFYITSQLFTSYHLLANSRALRQPYFVHIHIWHPLFSYLESSVDGIVPNEYEHPFSILKNMCQWLIRSPRPAIGVRWCPFRV